MKIYIKRYKLIAIFALVCTLLISGVLASVYAQQSVIVNDSEKPLSTITPLQRDTPKETKEYVIEKGDTFPGIMNSFGLSGSDAVKMIEASKKIYDFTKIKTGQIFKIVFVQDVVDSVEYVITDHKMVEIEKRGDEFIAKESDIKYEIQPTTAEATIHSSLFTDGSAAGLEDKTIMEFADLFGWDADFTTDIREGDSFKVIYEKRTLDGKPAKSGKILAAWFENQGQKYWAVLYKDPDGNEKYYDLEGKSVARQFLKSALDYKYVTTNFTNRRINPVTKKIEAHYAVDFAASQGTPVVALGDGKVSYAGWKGGYGNNIEIKHGGSYLTQYAHLSKFAKDVDVGTSVKQGQVIGYVGSTGISTGPHLHFAIRKNGNPLDPLKLKLPEGEAIKAAWKEDFDVKKADAVSLL